ncbi:PAS domain S-box protein [Pantanalinema sp. GBBB05]|uniref:PAS domain S-box protein n=1 Tax=Pantanalinema sp. GBBB05 TaxID=2604139 RepID=UPI001E1456DD|nr:PAS domain S-box protein [Pantanalinema sp. GBBB05]
MDTSIACAVYRQPPTIVATAFVQDAIVSLAQANYPGILVVEPGTPDARLVGLFTERDALQVIASGIHQLDCCVSEVMTVEFLTVSESELQDLDSVLALFEQQHLVILPVVNQTNQPIGVITQASLLKTLRFTLQNDRQVANELQVQQVNHQQVETALGRQLNRALLIQRITDAIRAQLEPQQIFAATVTQVGQAFGVSRCCLLLYTSTPTAQLSLAAEYGEVISLTATEQAAVLVSLNTLQVLVRDQAVVLPNVYAEPSLQPIEFLCQRIGLKSMLIVRTSYQGQANGILVLEQFNRFRQWSQNDIQLIESIAAQVGIALAQIRLLEQEQRQREILDQQNLMLQQEIRDRQQAEEHLELFFAQSLDGFFFMMLDQPIDWNATIDKEQMLDYVFAHQRITKVNDAMLDQYGASREQFLGLTPNDLFAHDLDQGRGVWRQFFDAGRLHIETNERKFDGSPVWIEGDYICLYDAQGRITGHFGVQRNVSDRKRTEEELRKSEERWQLVIKASNDGIFDLDLQTGTVFRSHQWAEMFGYEPNEVPNREIEWLSRIHPDDYDRVVAATVANYRQETQVFAQEYRFRCQDGSYKWVLDRSLLVWDEVGRPVRLVGSLSDISERKQVEDERQQAEETLRRQQEFLRTVIDTPPNLIFAKDWNGRFVLANQATAEIYGVSVEELIGKTDADFNPNLAEVEQFLQADREVITTGQLKLIEETVTSAMGVTQAFQTIKKPIISIDGDSVLALGIATDITDRKQAEAALRSSLEQQAELLAQTQKQSADLEKAKDAAEAASRAKSEFLANMSHELRTPLNVILGFTQIMSRDRSLKAEHRDYVGIISRSGRHLLALINDVLEMSKIEAGRLKLHPTSFDLYHLLDTLYEMLHLKANAKHLSLTFDRSAHLPQYITTDEGKLRQVLLNLLGNAIKFTSVGSVTLRVSVESGEKDIESAIDRAATNPVITCSASLPSPPLTLTFQVEDTGLGIAADDIQRLFTPFMQTPTGQQSSEGTGLGLAISQKFVQLMGGEITVESIVDQGSMFQFYIQVEPTEMAQLPSFYPTQRVIGLAPDQPNYRLLVVEDRWENQQILLKLLQPLGFTIQVANNGQEGIAVWEDWQPHLILMDMRMPVMDGYEATRRIKATTIGQETIVIAVTSSAFEEDRSAILAMGCDDFISKPFQDEEVFAKLAEHLGVRYLYEDSDSSRGLAPSLNANHLTAELFQVMPKQWINQVHQAAILGKDHQILKLIEQIPQTAPELATGLRALIADFRFEDIVQLTQPTG